jgi:hypothetical protein
MFKIIQTIHHCDGQDPHRFVYNGLNNFAIALHTVNQLNLRAAQKNMNTDSIPVIYHIEKD